MTVTGLGFPVVASTLALVCGAAAAMVIAVLLRDRVGPRVAFAAVLVYATFVASPILQVAYTESLAMLLLAAFLLALSRERWLLASALAVGIGVTRPIAVPLGVVALVAVVLRWRHRSGRRLARGEAFSMVAVLAACGLAGLAWPAIAWWRTGVRSAYTDTMATWRGSGEVTPFRPWLDISRYVAGDTVGPTGLAALVVVLVLMVVGPWARALGPAAARVVPGLSCLPRRRPRPVDQHLPLRTAAVPARRRARRRWLGRSLTAGAALAHGLARRGRAARAGLVGVGALPLRAAVGLPAVTVVRAVAPVRAIRDRVLSWPTWAVLLGFYLLTRVVVALVIQGAAVCCQNPAGVGTVDPGYLDMVGIWDGTWYHRIADTGYPSTLPYDPVSNKVTFSAWAFYPVFPMVLRLLGAVGLPFLLAATVVNVAAGAASVLLVWRLLSARAGDCVLHRRMALLATMLWCLYPATAVLQIAYSEALGMALLAAFLCLLLQRRYLWCAAVVLLLGLTRAVAPPLAVVVLAHLILRWRSEAAAGSRRPLAGQRVSAVVMVGPPGCRRWRGRSSWGWSPGTWRASSSPRLRGARNRGRARSWRGCSGPGAPSGSPACCSCWPSSRRTSRSWWAGTAAGWSRRCASGRWPTRCSCWPSCARSPACGGS